MGFAHLHFVGFERPWEIEREAFGFFPVEAAVVVARLEDNGHAGMDPAHEFVGRGGNDGEALEPVALLSFQASQSSAKPIGLPLASSKL